MRRLLRALVLAGVAATLGLAAEAADIRVLTAGAFRAVLDELIPSYEERSGNRVIVQQDTAAGVAQRIARGEPFDIAVLTPATVGALEHGGKILATTPVASVGIAVAVRRGAPKPDISSVDAFKAALLAASSVAMVDPEAGGTSGIYLMKLFERLGIAEQMKPKLVLVHGGSAAEPVAAGRADLAVQQASELTGVRGVTVVGPLPPEVQQRTVYVAGLNPKAPDAALVLLALLAGPQARAVLEEKGMEPP